MRYTDVMVAAVADAQKEAYVAYARDLGALFRSYGATRVVDTWGSDVPEGKVTDFRRAVQAGEGESVAVGWIEWPDKATRDAAWDELMQDQRMADMKMPFDGKRMIYGGFETLVVS